MHTVYAGLPGNVSAFVLSPADKLYGDADFQQDLASANILTSDWLTDHGFTVLNWPASLSNLNPIENLWAIVKRKMTPDPTIQIS